MSDKPRASTAEELARYADGFNASVMLRHFGLHLTFSEAGRVRGVIAPVQPWMRGGLGSAAVNGGVIAATFDLVLGVTPALVDTRHRTATMQLDIAFLRPLTGDQLVAEAWIDRAGKATIFAAGRILDAAGEVCAKASGLVKVSNVEWQNAGTPAT